MAPSLSNVMIEIRNLWKVVHENAEKLRDEIHNNTEKIVFINTRLVGDHDDTGTIFGRVKAMEEKVSTLMDIKKEIDAIAKKKSSWTLKAKDVFWIVVAGLTIYSLLKSTGII